MAVTIVADVKLGDWALGNYRKSKSRMLTIWQGGPNSAENPRVSDVEVEHSYNLLEQLTWGRESELW